MTNIHCVYIVGMLFVQWKLGVLSGGSWSTDLMIDYLKHWKSLVSKGKKKPVVTTHSSSTSAPPSVSPSVSSLVSNPSLPSVGDDQKIKDYVHSFLSSFLLQSGSVGINPSFSAPTEVPNPAPPLLSDTQMSSSLRSQQALVDVASRSAGARSRRPSPRRSPTRASSSRHRRRESGSPARCNKRVRFDSPARVCP